MPNRFSLLSALNFHGKSLQAARMKSAANQQTRRRGTIWQHAALLEIIQNGVWSFRKIYGCKLKWKKNKRDFQTSQSWEDFNRALFAKMSNLPGGTTSPCGQKILGALPARLPAAARKLWDLQSWNRPVNRRPGKNISEVSVPATWKKQCWIVLNHSIEDDR